jgi:hypothetical protein
VDKQVQPAGTQAAFLQRRAEVGDQLAEVARDGLGRRDRFREGAAGVDLVGGAHGVERFGHLPQRLIDPAGKLRPEAQGQRGARLAVQFTYRPETQCPEVAGHRRRQAQGLQRQE